MFSRLEPLNQAKQAVVAYSRDNNGSIVSGLIGGVVPMVMGVVVVRFSLFVR